MADIIYTEKQRPRKVWLWVLILSISAINIYSIYQHIYLNNSGSIPYLEVIISILIILLFFTLKLVVKITDKGIQYRFSPFSFSETVISWDQIDECYVRKYSPIGEYGGWGLRFGFKSGKAYNISGNMGLQIITKKGKKILLGTQRPDELQKVIDLKFNHPE